MPGPPYDSKISHQKIRLYRSFLVPVLAGHARVPSFPGTQLCVYGIACPCRSVLRSSCYICFRVKIFVLATFFFDVREVEKQIELGFHLPRPTSRTNSALTCTVKPPRFGDHWPLITLCRSTASSELLLHTDTLKIRK